MGRIWLKPAHTLTLAGLAIIVFYTMSRVMDEITKAWNDFRAQHETTWWLIGFVLLISLEEFWLGWKPSAADVQEVLIFNLLIAAQKKLRQVRSLWYYCCTMLSRCDDAHHPHLGISFVHWKLQRVA